jgi:hypothetical protein
MSRRRLRKTLNLNSRSALASLSKLLDELYILGDHTSQRKSRESGFTCAMGHLLPKGFIGSEFLDRCDEAMGINGGTE